MKRCNLRIIATIENESGICALLCEDLKGNIKAHIHLSPSTIDKINLIDCDIIGKIIAIEYDNIVMNDYIYKYLSSPKFIDFRDDVVVDDLSNTTYKDNK